MWPCCGPGQLPHMGQFCACSLPCMCLLIAISVPVDCHIWASCLPHRCLFSATCGPYVGQTTATCGPHVGQRCKTRVAHMCALRGRQFQLPHVGLVWPTCGMFAGKEVPEHRSSVNYAGVHPWETPTVVLITNNGNGINYRHCLGETKHCTTPIYSVICIAKYIRYQMCCVCAEGREPRKTERYVS